jgi:hypothetical protein
VEEAPSYSFPLPRLLREKGPFSPFSLSLALLRSCALSLSTAGENLRVRRGKASLQKGRRRAASLGHHHFQPRRRGRSGSSEEGRTGARVSSDLFCFAPTPPSSSLELGYSRNMAEGGRLRRLFCPGRAPPFLVVGDVGGRDKDRRRPLPPPVATQPSSYRPYSDITSTDPASVSRSQPSLVPSPRENSQIPAHAAATPGRISARVFWRVSAGEEARKVEGKRAAAAQWMSFSSERRAKGEAMVASSPSSPLAPHPSPVRSLRLFFPGAFSGGGGWKWKRPFSFFFFFTWFSPFGNFPPSRSLLYTKATFFVPPKMTEDSTKVQTE